MSINNFIDTNKGKIAFQVGYDIQDITAASIIVDLIEAGVADMVASGVTEATIINNKLSIITLAIFVKDNLNITSGDNKISPMYISNVQKLKLVPTQIEQEGEQDET